MRSPSRRARAAWSTAPRSSAIESVAVTGQSYGPWTSPGYAGRLRAAVLSDVHSNQPALEAVLAAIDAAGVEEIWCLGDVVGYGAQPDACADLIQQRCDVCLVGNHDLAVLGRLDIATFSDTAAVAVEWTQEHVSAATLEFLRGLEPAGDAGRHRPLPRLPPRPDLGVRALGRPGGSRASTRRRSGSA